MGGLGWERLSEHGLQLFYSSQINSRGIFSHRA